MPLQTLMNQLGSAGKRNGRARQQRLYDLLRRAILDGVLVEGWNLPGSRQLAQEYRLSRNSVIYAYELLRVEGFVQTDRRGTRVAKLVLPASKPPSLSEVAPLALSKRALHMGQERHGGEHLPFAPGVPDVNLFPWRKWFRHLERAWESVGARQRSHRFECVGRAIVFDSRYQLLGTSCG